MALTNLRALDVVIGSVNGVSGQTPTPTETLKTGGIVDAPRLQAFKGLVVADPGLGVKKHNHEIAPSALSGVGIDDTVQATADVVRANATPIGAAERAPIAAAETAARQPTSTEVTAPGPRRARKAVRAAKKAGKKAGKKARKKVGKKAGKKSAGKAGKKKATKTAKKKGRSR